MQHVHAHTHTCTHAHTHTYTHTHTHTHTNGVLVLCSEDILQNISEHIICRVARFDLWPLAPLFHLFRDSLEMPLDEVDGE